MLGCKCFPTRPSRIDVASLVRSRFVHPLENRMTRQRGHFQIPLSPLPSIGLAIGPSV
jgi:hypothetical protein